jgi:hypothetical protein
MYNIVLWHEMIHPAYNLFLAIKGLYGTVAFGKRELTIAFQDFRFLYGRSFLAGTFARISYQSSAWCGSCDLVGGGCGG